jgi:hypothetical protein
MNNRGKKTDLQEDCKKILFLHKISMHRRDGVYLPVNHRINPQ